MIADLKKDGKLEGKTNKELAGDLDVNLRAVERKLAMIGTNGEVMLTMNESQPRSRDQQPMSRRECVDRVSDEFEQQWKEGEAPRIESFLSQVDQDDRELLLRELIAMEMALRDEAGQPVDPQEYRRRFAADSQIVDSAMESFQKRRDADESLPPTEVVRHDEGAHKRPPAASGPQEDIPKRIDRYEIIPPPLGQGGFATVYLARDTDLDREVALKVPRMDRFENEAALEFFVEEARKAAQLDHPGIVRVHDVRREPGLVYIVQQYLSGGDLSQHIKSKRLPPRRVAELMIAIAQAVGYAHQQRYTHLDLKPANILLDEDGNPYVADFGLAVHESVQHDMEGQVFGTYLYMSPEQARGEVHRLDGRSDIWSLGVILYALLTGQRPFAGKTRAKPRDQIEHHNPRPPRMIDPNLPGELSRICLACLVKRATDRYASTADLIDDLRHWLDEKPRTRDADATDAQPDGSADRTAVKVIPQGLRSFEAEHADFYLELLPGPHDREGLPKQVRFWKTQIEKTDPDETFSVGLMYGPSGCGKSSLVKAGLLPRISDEVLPIYVEATGGDTEVRLIKTLRKRCPELPAEASLPELIAKLREHGGSRGRKVLIVLDQFEQWLHAHESREDSQLVPALRHCDGASVQCLVLVRDDFWMSATRFMKALEVPLLEGYNSEAVELFELKHARKVLTAFGRAYDQLPDMPAEPNTQQVQFLTNAVEGLADEGKVVCVRIAVFAEMMKGRPWTNESLTDVGGAEGVGVTFLEETFSAKTAPPSHRLHQKAVRAVLKSLLPEPGAKIKGQMKSYEELIEAADYKERRADFGEVLGILDSEVRLITPTEPDELNDDKTDDSEENTARYYQLTHDFLVPSLRDWLTRKQRETRRGRAELRLAERSALWNSKPENRHLPSLWEWAGIRTLTHANKWSEPQRKMMRSAGLVHALRWGAAIGVVLVIGVIVQRITSSVEQRNLTKRVQIAVSSLNTSRGIILPPLESFEEFPRGVLLSELQAQLEERADSRKLPLVYALAHYGDVRVDFLMSHVEGTLPDEADNFADALGHAKQDAQDAIDTAARSVAENAGTPALRHKARLAMLSLNLGDQSLASDMCQLRADPIQRTVFIDECSSWYGDLVQLSNFAQEIENAPLRSALCLVVGGVPAERVTREHRDAWEPILTDWHRRQPDTGTHSASGWALRKWELPLRQLPVGEPEQSEEQQLVADAKWRLSDASWNGVPEWHVNGVGLTMLRIPSGQVSNEQRETIEVKEDFLLSDREISVGLFQQFMDDPNYPDAEKPKDWEGVDRLASPTSEHPAQRVSWNDAVMFCNWLSLQEGKSPCYKRTGEKDKDYSGKQIEQDAWQLDSPANGYRLPTEAEWEFACRAGTTTTFSFGDNAKWLDAYGVARADHAESSASQLPNGWGLFDMHGNVYEWCDSKYDDGGSVQVYRGGSWGSTAGYCRSSNRSGLDPSYRYSDLGFRVASVPSSHVAGGEASSGAESGSR